MRPWRKISSVQPIGRSVRETALVWLKNLGERLATRSVARLGLAVAFRRLKRPEEAERTLRDGLGRFPDEVELIAELGWRLLDRNELEEALPLWRKAIMVAPDQPRCHVGLATTLRRMLSFDESDTVLSAATQLFPDSCFVHSNHAVIADLKGDRREALDRWQAVFDRFPNEPIGYAGLGAALKMLGRFDEADATLALGMSRFPDDANVAINHAWVAVTAADWPEAIRRWTGLRSKWPNDLRIKTGLSETLMHAEIAAADAAAESDAGAAACYGESLLSDDSPRGIMMGFESIGENCELGFAQRHFEAEPLDLFRWAGISYDRLLEALQNELAGIGDDENTILGLNPNNREYFTEDRRYGMSLHSFILEGENPAELIKKKLCRRLSYLREKFLEDIRNDTKIFVFNTPLPLSDEQIRRLHEGLCRYRPVSLLCVAPDTSQPAGAVTRIGAGLWRGNLARTGYNGRVWDVDFSTWLTICSSVKRLNAMHSAAMLT